MYARESMVRAFRDGLFLQLGMYATAVVVMILGLKKLPEIAASERDMFFGILLVMTLSTLMVLMGMINQLLHRQEKAERAGSDKAA
jgi:hypothetical protein